MKALLLILAVLTSSAAHGGEFTQFGRVLFQSASTWVSGDKVCQADGRLYHKELQAVTVERCERDNQSDCDVELRPLEQPIESTRKRCAQFANGDKAECTRYEEVPFIQGPKLKIEIYNSQEDLEDKRPPREVRLFTIPSCM